MAKSSFLDLNCNKIIILNIVLKIRKFSTPEAVLYTKHLIHMPGVGLMVRVVDLGFEDPEFKSHLAV